MVIKRFFLLITLASLYIVSRVSPAYACSGYPYFGVKDLPDADTLVKATVIDTDDRGYSAVLRVEDYYKGEGPRFITVMRYPVALETGAAVRGYYTACLYAGQGDSLWKGDQGYFGLKPNGNGTYTDYIHGTAHFYPVDGEIHYQEGATEGYRLEYDSELVISEKDFITKLLEAGGRKVAIAPKVSTPERYPLMRFLDITTKNGTRYQINPDRSLSKLPEGWPIAISPDGAHVAFRLDDQTIAFQYIWTEYQARNEMEARSEESLKKLMVKGKAVAFSSDSNLVAVWDAEQLAIYLITNERQDSENAGLNLREVAVQPFAASTSTSLPSVIWSANGSTLAWQDSSGVWRWNIVDEPAPSKVITGNNPLMDISSYGRFVQVGTWAAWRLLDSVTGKVYPNTIAAPNEAYLIAINHKAELGTHFGAVAQDCKPPLRENCKVNMSASDLSGTFGFQMELLGTISCHESGDYCELESRSWHPAIGKGDYSGGRFFNAFIQDFRAVRYDMQYQQPALLVGDYDIYFDFYSTMDVEDKEYRPYLDILNLKDQVDSPIVSIEWGQPVFYDSYLLSSMEYSP